MNTEDYVSYPIALALKKAGFNEQCMAFYDHTDGKKWLSVDGKEDWNSGVDYSAPTLWQAQKWLREKKELCVTVYAQPYNGLPYYTGYILFNGDEKEILDQDGHWFDDYEQCLSETIAAALELIEEKGE